MMRETPALQAFLGQHEELCVAVKGLSGAQGRDRTTDTAIFSRMLYQLSYLGILGRPKGLGERAVYREVGGPCPPGFAFGYTGRGPVGIPSPSYWQIALIRRLR